MLLKKGKKSLKVLEVHYWRILAETSRTEDQTKKEIKGHDKVTILRGYTG